MNEAEKLARDCDESADIWANEIDTRRKAAALLRRQAEQIKLLREALARLLSSDPEGAIATASEDDLTEAANDASADPVVREQAASVLQARSALAATKEAE